MIFLIVLFCVSLFGIAVGIILPELSDLLLIAVPIGLASLILLLRHRTPAKPLHRIVLDGSNVMYWKGGTPEIETVSEVLARVTDLGYAPGVVFDANAGHLLFGRYRHDHYLSKTLNLKESHVMVVPKGTPADPYILTAARDMGAQIVTNDQYRDWADEYPEIATKGHLIKGSYRGGEVWLDLPPAPLDEGQKP